MDPKILLSLLIPIIDGVVQKSKSPLVKMGWEVLKGFLAANGPKIAAELKKEMTAKGMSTGK